MLHLLIPLPGVIFRYQAPYIKHINVLNWTGRGQGERINKVQYNVILKRKS
jgi:uncharacterized C2H2 Zn-finger protein